MPKPIKVISIAKDFSEYPAGRYRDDGEASGEAFRDDILVPALKDEKYAKVKVILDGVAGFGSSFLEEAFGGLVRNHGIDPSVLDRHLEISTDEDDLKDYVSLSRKYIREAAARKNNG